ncbi:MAG: 6,7-dimethyl-8-ribityllumazine synthase [Alphaproteobacteria bacterium]|nr:6,7-dimethyl-8-ribityllumazine synthase [Alphaproteobacteria bacterium]
MERAEIAYIEASWHDDILAHGRKAFVAELAKTGRTESSVEIHRVPGSFEIPLLAKRLAQSGRHRAIVAAGLIVDGGIYRHEFVAHAVIDGLMRVQLDTGVPVLSMVLTPQNFHEHEAHYDFFVRHFVIKGTEAARACVRTIELHAGLDRTVKIAS